MTKLKDHDNGAIQINDDVIATIAGTAALEVDGVLPVAASFVTHDIASMLMKKNFWKGITIEKTDDGICVEINLLIKLGFKINEVSSAVQARIKEALETMTGLVVVRVDVVVYGVVQERVKRVKTRSQKPETRCQKAEAGSQRKQIRK